jgi:hypothetical protein
MTNKDVARMALELVIPPRVPVTLSFSTSGDLLPRPIGLRIKFLYSYRSSYPKTTLGSHVASSGKKKTMTSPTTWRIMKYAIPQ